MKKKDLRFERLTAPYESSDIVWQMNSHMHHGTITTLEHCRHVAWDSFVLNRKLGLGANEKALIAGAMLHDLYLYDRHDGKPERKTHRQDHPDIAFDNAKKFFNLSETEKEIIQTHMWPFNPHRVPESTEARIICLVDKYCAVKEMIEDSRLWTLASRKKHLLFHYSR